MSLGDSIAERALRAMDEGVFPGCVVGIVRRGGERVIYPMGGYTYEKHARPVRANTVYDLASVTKSIPTASLALALAYDEKIRLDDTVRHYIPELANDYDATLRDLLLYRVAGPRLSELRFETPDDMLAAIFLHGFSAPPGEPNYTNLPALLLGIAIERSAGTTLDVLARRYFFDPLKMRDTAFFAGHPISHSAPTEHEEWRGTVQGVTHDESAFVLARSGKVPGHAGLFSTAPDMLSFLSMLLEGKEPHAVAIAQGAALGLGWQIAQESFMGVNCSGRTFGKTGFTGTSVIADVDRGVAFCILSNRTFPQRPADQSAIFRFRRDIADVIFATLR